MTQTQETIQLEPIQPATLQVEATDISREALQNKDASIPDHPPAVTKGRAIIVLFQLTAVISLTSVTTGLMNVSVPIIASDLGIDPALRFWPLSVYSLTSGSCLLLAGSVADVVGSRPLYLAGCFMLGSFVLGCGLAQTGIQLIMFRAFQGIGTALCLPTSIAILTYVIPAGKMRNVGFSCLGMGQVLGFATGLVLSGALTESIGWRAEWYLCGGLIMLLLAIGVWSIPPDSTAEPRNLKRLKTDVDWVGACLATASLTILAYVFVMLSSKPASIETATNIALLTLSVALGAAFVFWVGRQEKKQKPALIPNSMWKNLSFTSICIMILLSYAVMQTMELYCSLFWHDIQHLKPLETSIRFLPSTIMAAIATLTTGLVVHRVPVIWLVTVTAALNLGAPLLMALIDPAWPYWYAAFPAQILQPVSPDVMFTVGILVVSEIFPPKTQALAGAVFNTVAQFGQAIGLALVGVVSETVTQESDFAEKDSTGALMAGYRAAFWACTGFMAVACLVGMVGLRGSGKVGLKRD